MVTDSHDVERQYWTPAALTDRYGIYRYSQTGRNLHEWIFSHLQLSPNASVLDIGCGPATLWVGRTDRLPPGIRVTLADQSEGMLAESRSRVGSDGRFAFVRALVDHLPFPTSSFDRVAALHMISHADSVPRAVRELRRVLRPEGSCYASTPSGRNLQEVRDLLTAYNPSLLFPIGRICSFLAEGALHQLRQSFPYVVVRHFVDPLIIPDPEPIVRYYLSIFDGNGYPDLRDQREALLLHVQEHMDRHGPLRTESLSDLFICRAG